MLGNRHLPNFVNLLSCRVIDRIEVLTPQGDKRKGEAIPRIVFGPTCDSVDRLPGEIALPSDLAEGDFVIWQGMGS